MRTVASAIPIRVAGEPTPASRVTGMSRSVSQLGFWSGIMTFVTSYTFFISGLLGMLGILAEPWSTIISVGASLLIAPSFVILMVSVHVAAPDDRKIWSLLGLAFTLLYAALVSIVYVTWLFVVEPHVVRGEAAQVAAFLFAPESFLKMVDGLGYTYSCVAALLTAWAFGGARLGRWIRWVGIANGVVVVPVFLSYVFDNILLGIWWQFTVPTFAILLAVYFRRAGRTVLHI